MMDFRFNGLGFFISDILSSFVRLFKLDIHPYLFARQRARRETQIANSEQRRGWDREATGQSGSGGSRNLARQSGQAQCASACCRRRVPAVCRWQMAIANASATSGGSGGAARSSRRATITCTCDFSALPYPTTADLIDSGEYATTPRPACAATSIATPRTCPSFSADLTFTA